MYNVDLTRSFIIADHPSDVECGINAWELRGHLTGLLSKIKPAVDKEVETRVDRTGQNHAFVTNVSIINVRLTISQIREKSVILDNLEKEGRILIIGGLYDIDTG